eukprot:6738155-Pyramimonas_sp.AAC.1
MGMPPSSSASSSFSSFSSSRWPGPWRSRGRSSAGEQKTFARELAVAKSRGKALALVSGTSDSELHEYIKSFATASDDASTAAGVGFADDNARIAAAPPCFGYENLLTMRSLKEKTSIPASLITEKDINEFDASVHVHFKSGLELGKSVAKAVSELYSARVTARTEQNKRKMAEEKEAIKRSKRMGSAQQSGGHSQQQQQQPDTNPFWKWTPQPENRIKTVEACEFKDIGIADLMKPIIVGKTTLADLYSNDNDLKKEVNDQLQGFRVRPDKSAGQFHGGISDKTVESRVADGFRANMPSAVQMLDITDDQKQYLSAIVQPEIWVRSPNTNTFGLEP